MPTQTASLRILVVEDDVDFAECFTAFLAGAGQELRVARDWFEALAIADDFAPDLVIVDVGLLGLDGFEVARRLRESTATAASALVALRGYCRPEDQGREDRRRIRPLPDAPGQLRAD